MQEAQAIIERIRRISPTIQRLDVAVHKAHREFSPGQLFLARIAEALDPYLREPWIPLDREGTHIVVERLISQGSGNYAPGQVVNLIGPVGKPIPIAETTRTLLLVAYEASPAALLMAANLTLARGGAVTLVLVGNARGYPIDALPPEIEIVRVDSHETWQDRDKALAWADQVIAVAPPSFDQVVYPRLLSDIRRVRIEPAVNYVLGLFHGPMPCGVGACQACLVRLTGGEEAAACLEGPAFDLLNVGFGAESK